MLKLPVTALLLLVATSLAADDTPRLRLERFIAGLDTLMADFSQQVIEAETGVVSRASGILYLSRPGRFRWVYKGEYPRYILADGKTVWLVEEDLEQVSQRSQRTALEGTPAGLLVDEIDLDEVFDIEELGIRMGLAWLKLRPRDEQSQFEEILLALDEAQLTRLEMTDRLGQVTRFDFRNIQRNIRLPDSLFQFVPPPGYDVLDQ